MKTFKTKLLLSFFLSLFLVGAGCSSTGGELLAANVEDDPCAENTEDHNHDHDDDDHEHDHDHENEVDPDCEVTPTEGEDEDDHDHDHEGEGDHDHDGDGDHDHEHEGEGDGTSTIVNPPVTIKSFQVAEQCIIPGSAITVSWDVENADQVFIGSQEVDAMGELELATNPTARGARSVQLRAYQEDELVATETLRIDYRERIPAYGPQSIIEHSGTISQLQLTNDGSFGFLGKATLLSGEEVSEFFYKEAADTTLTQASARGRLSVPWVQIDHLAINPKNLFEAYIAYLHGDYDFDIIAGHRAFGTSSSWQELEKSFYLPAIGSESSQLYTINNMLVSQNAPGLVYLASNGGLSLLNEGGESVDRRNFSDQLNSHIESSGNSGVEHIVESKDHLVVSSGSAFFNFHLFGVDADDYSAAIIDSPFHDWSVLAANNRDNPCGHIHDLAMVDHQLFIAGENGLCVYHFRDHSEDASDHDHGVEIGVVHQLYSDTEVTSLDIIKKPITIGTVTEYEVYFATPNGLKMFNTHSEEMSDLVNEPVYEVEAIIKRSGFLSESYIVYTTQITSDADEIITLINMGLKRNVEGYVEGCDSHETHEDSVIPEKPEDEDSEGSHDSHTH